MKRHSAEIRKAWRTQVPVMTRIRNAVAIGYAIVLLIGLGLSFHGFAAAIQADAQGNAFALPEGVIAFGWFVLTLAYGVAFARKGLNLAAPFFYLVTYALIGVGTFLAFATTAGSNTLYLAVLAMGGVSIVPLALGGYGLLLNTRRAQPTLFHPPVRSVKPWW